ncbi:MAG: CarD family transcriptional regulator, partial [Nitrospinae bacterium]|nr:CarD family transcriptional regulator [Nitrospinota bacterium]
MFRMRDRIIYPAHGIGIIDRIEEKILSGKKRSFYVIKILENGV